MELRTHRGLAGPQLYWVGLGCLILSVAAFTGGFAAGNSLEPRGAVFLVVVGLVISIVTSVVAVVLTVAGLVAFPQMRGRFGVLLVLCLAFSPLLWLGLVAASL